MSDRLDEASSVAARLSRLALGWGQGGWPPEALHAAKRCIIDWYAATLPGSLELPARALEQGLFDELGQGPATTLSGLRAPMRTAALINGTASHTVEFDDIFAPAIYHPGSPTIAAALAVAQGLGKSGRDLIAAVIAGYEVSTRIGIALGREHYRYWHNTGTVGTFGAAVAAGVLRNLDERRMAHALAIAATLAAGLQQAFRGDSQTKPLHAGHAADAGLLAAAMAEGGIAGARDMFEGEAGLGAAMSEGVDWDAALVDSESFNITRITVKNHGCCGHIFAALDGLLAMKQAHHLTSNDIESIEVGGYSATVTVTGNYDADTAAAAKFCLPFILASGLVHGSIRLDACSDARLNDSAVRALMPRIAVTLDPEVDARFPNQRSAKLRLVLRDGRTLNFFQPHRVGDPDLPLSDRQLEEKFMELAGSALEMEKARVLLQRLWTVETAPSLAFATEVATARQPGAINGP